MSLNNNRQVATIVDKSIYYSTQSYNLQYSVSTNYSLIYVTENNASLDLDKNLIKSRYSEDLKLETREEINDTFAHYFINIDTIFIPKKAKRHLQRNAPKFLLIKIDKDPDKAIEKCLVLLSNLSSTIFSEEKWKNLSSTIMNEQTKTGKDNSRIYTSCLDVLKYSTNTTQGIIEVKTNESGGETYQQGVACKAFRLTKPYLEAGLTKYVIKHKELVSTREKFYRNLLIKVKDNIIANNLFILYPRITLPIHEEMNAESKKLVNTNYVTKKGNKLVLLNKHSRSSKSNKISYVEDHIKQFEYLTQLGFMIPTIGDDKSGGRVVDSFILMPSWIRSLVKIDGESIVEVDFKAFHPNIAMSIYGGSKKFLTHKKVEEESGIDIKEVKIQHLSFFNKEVRDMKKSPLYNYYKESEPLLLEKIENEKRSSEFKHKITSMRMFAKEVEIMTECIRRLNIIGVYVGYVYDALFCKASDNEMVKKIMNEVTLELGVYTKAE